MMREGAEGASVHTGALFSVHPQCVCVCIIRNFCVCGSVLALWGGGGGVGGGPQTGGCLGVFAALPQQGCVR